jgi:hypothetical protein
MWSSTQVFSEEHNVEQMEAATVMDEPMRASVDASLHPVAPAYERKEAESV